MNEDHFKMQPKLSKFLMEALETRHILIELGKFFGDGYNETLEALSKRK